ncbi:hypothetical protein [Magnetospirillum moscoviense]|uniref:SWIM-type domain-containing protein n=1 Tax=Magnetospirillum moscoviense TaxID=1437059 RepID=A0A178MQQ5_9PROT|nr:hypothetical protein [Magnetospirillum moscoviense]OAN51307.1 hypothetical protein A6A05_11110 [Magnetospirillum moscoviense]
MVRWAPYVPVAERRKKAEREMVKRRKAGQAVSPVVITGRTIASSAWGKAWCDTMESFGDYDSRLPRGRSYVRNGSVVDLQITAGKVTAQVAGSSLYAVTVTIHPLPKSHWQILRKDCADSIDSLVDLLQGKLSKPVMERLCRPGTGLFPKSSEIKFSCSCPDWASMCKHVAATLYGIGARLDHQPELLFALRGVDHHELITDFGQGGPLAKAPPSSANILETDDVAALFGLDMVASPAPPMETPSQPKPAARKKKSAPAKADMELTADGYVKWWKD